MILEAASESEELVINLNGLEIFLIMKNLTEIKERKTIGRGM